VDGMAAEGRSVGGGQKLSPRLVRMLLALGIVMIVGGTSAPLALYETYKHEYGFSDFTLAGLASCSVLGVIASVVFAGRLSDAIGRRRVMLPGLGLGGLMLVLLGTATNVELLFAGRLVGGFAVGLYAGAATAALTELAPGGDTRRAARLAGMASVAGFASGPVIGGIFLEYLPWKLHLVYGAYGLLLLPTVAGVILMRETVVQRGPWSLRPQRLRTPPGGERTFALASLLALCAYSLTCMFQSLGPSIVIRLLDLDNRAIVTVLVSVFLTASAIVQIRLRTWSIRRATLIGLSLLPVGGLLITLAVIEGSIEAFVAGCVIGGIGHGLTYLGGQSLVELVAPPEIRGEVFATYLIVVYMSGSAPATLLGFIARQVGLHSAIVGYTITVSSLAAATLILCLRAVRREPTRRGEEVPVVSV
jgi:MFS family permease